jgi:hypothetical protein
LKTKQKIGQNSRMMFKLFTGKELFLLKGWLKGTV